MNQAVGPGTLRPLGVGEVLDVAITLYRRNFMTLIKAVAVVTVPVNILAGAIQQSAQADADDLTRTRNVFGETSVEVDSDKIWTVVAGVVLAFILTFVATQLASGACVRIVSGAYLDERPGWKESLRFAAKKLRSLVWLALLYGFIPSVALLACIAPGVFLYVAWAVAVPVLLLEDTKGFKAFNRSQVLVRPRWWPVFGVILLSTLLTTIISGALAALFTVPLINVDSDIVFVIFATLGSTLAAVLTTPFSAAVIIVMYVDLRVRREGFDLELLARRMGVAPPTGPVPEMFRGWAPPQWVPPPYGAPPPGWQAPPGWQPPPAGWAPPPSAAQPPPYWPPPPGWQPPQPVVPEPKWEGPPEDWQPPPGWDQPPAKPPPPPPKPPPPPAPRPDDLDDNEP